MLRIDFLIFAMVNYHEKVTFTEVLILGKSAMGFCENVVFL